MRAYSTKKSSAKYFTTGFFARKAMLTASDNYIKTEFIKSDVYTKHVGEFGLYNDIRGSFDGSFKKESSTNEFDRISSELVSYQNLEEDWDGYEGIAPNYTTIALAFNFLSDIYFQRYKLPKVMLSGSGAISFFWKNKETNFYLEVEFDSEDCYSYFFDKNGQISGKDDINFHNSGISEDIINLLKLVYSEPVLEAA